MYYGNLSMAPKAPQRRSWRNPGARRAPFRRLRPQIALACCGEQPLAGFSLKRTLKKVSQVAKKSVKAVANAPKAVAKEVARVPANVFKPVAKTVTKSFQTSARGVSRNVLKPAGTLVTKAALLPFTANVKLAKGLTRVGSAALVKAASGKWGAGSPSEVVTDSEALPPTPVDTQVLAPEEVPSSIYEQPSYEQPAYSGGGGGFPSFFEPSYSDEASPWEEGSPEEEYRETAEENPEETEEAAAFFVPEDSPWAATPDEYGYYADAEPTEISPLEVGLALGGLVAPQLGFLPALLPFVSNVIKKNTGGFKRLVSKKASPPAAPSASPSAPKTAKLPIRRPTGVKLAPWVLPTAGLGVLAFFLLRGPKSPSYTVIR